tara:strand:- start:321 stop:497 length:177 start_codon:yes stop_codon:yes gene_type:complete
MITYLEQLNKLASAKDIKLRYAFKMCGIHDSTYHRLIKNQTRLREDTAKKVWDWINGI